MCINPANGRGVNRSTIVVLGNGGGRRGNEKAQVRIREIEENSPIEGNLWIFEGTGNVVIVSAIADSILMRVHKGASEGLLSVGLGRC